jgi:hypothetical protein
MTMRDERRSFPAQAQAPDEYETRRVTHEGAEERKREASEEEIQTIEKETED